MSSPEVFIECPFCEEKRANYLVLKLSPHTTDGFGRIDLEANVRGEGKCFICSNLAVLYFRAVESERPKRADSLSILQQHLPQAKKTPNGLEVAHFDLECVQTFPEPKRFECPDKTPERISEVFLEADANYRDKRWRSAVTSYGTALDFAALAVMDGEEDENLRLALGQKMKKLRQQQLLPGSLVDLMEIGNLERKLSVHYPDKVDEDAARAARAVTVATLEYLFTLPQQIHDAKARLDKAQSAS